jgi:hypothetical protein
VYRRGVRIFARQGTHVLECLCAQWKTLHREREHWPVHVPRDLFQLVLMLVTKVEQLQYNAYTDTVPIFNACLFSPVTVKPQCSRHDDCSDTEVCHQGSCQEACRFQVCGLNAQCLSSNHLAKCECLPSMHGNPTVACKPSKDNNTQFIYFSKNACLIPLCSYSKPRALTRSRLQQQ